jgi:hypothetical protein
MPSDPATPPPAVLPKRGVRGAAEEIGEVPIYVGERYTLGMRLASSIWGERGSSYFLAPNGGANRYTRRFPLNQKGWDRMWQQFAAADPAGALAYKQGPDRQRARTEESAAQDPLDRLERLAALHRQGSLTDDEFEAAKRELLKKL